jgi:hypothetical protein
VYLEPVFPADNQPDEVANKAATEVADRGAVDMESKAHMDDEKRKMSGYPSTMLQEMRGGHSLYPPYVPGLGTEAEDSIWSCQDEAAVIVYFCSIIITLYCVDGGSVLLGIEPGYIVFPSQK